MTSPGLGLVLCVRVTSERSKVLGPVIGGFGMTGSDRDDFVNCNIRTRVYAVC